MESERADKWLWATRFYKTRPLAAKSCELGKVTRGEYLVKPATPLRVEDVIEMPFPDGPGRKIIRVKALIGLRVGAPLAQACYEDLTPPAVYEANRQALIDKRDAGGRPTKRDRRQIGRIRGFWD